MERMSNGMAATKKMGKCKGSQQQNVIERKQDGKKISGAFRHHFFFFLFVWRP
jgi:hypothetical protein